MDQDDYAMDKATTRMTSFQHEKRAPGQDYSITDNYYNSRGKLLERGLQFEGREYYNKNDEDYMMDDRDEKIGITGNVLAPAVHQHGGGVRPIYTSSS
jgi:hypothetical protein